MCNAICIFASFLVHLTSYICLAASPFLVKIVTSKILRHHCKSKRRHQLGYIKSYFEPLNLLYQSLFWNFDSALSNPILNLWFCYINFNSLFLIAQKFFCVGLCYQLFNYQVLRKSCGCIGYLMLCISYYFTPTRCTSDFATILSSYPFPKQFLWEMFLVQRCSLHRWSYNERRNLVRWFSIEEKRDVERCLRRRLIGWNATVELYPTTTDHHWTFQSGTLEGWSHVW